MKSNEKGRTISDPFLDLENSLGLLFDFFSSKLKLTNKSFRLYGHSGGSQFVHRYLLLSEELRIDKVAMVNTGFYTLDLTPTGNSSKKSEISLSDWINLLSERVFIKFSAFIIKLDLEITCLSSFKYNFTII